MESDLLARKLREFIASQDPPRSEATAARAALSRTLGRLISAHEFEKAVGILRSADSPIQRLSETKTRSRRWLGLYVPRDEMGLYPSIKEYLSQQWLVREEHGLTDVKAGDVVETWTAGGDGRPRPDMMAWIVTGNETSRRINFVSFEVKPDGAPPLDAVSQAHSQRNFVNFAYLIQQIGPDSTRLGGEQLYRARCLEYDIGLIVFGEQQEGGEFRVALQAPHNPDPRDAMAFFGARVKPHMEARARQAVGYAG